MITRSTRQRKPETVLKLAEAQIKNSGADELGLLSVSFASMGAEIMTPKLAEQVATVRKRGFDERGSRYC